VSDKDDSGRKRKKTNAEARQKGGLSGASITAE
jgi:hypothetical protein